MAAFGFGTPFKEQIDFLLAKLNLPSDRWDDIQRSAHDRAFIVAGARKADLVQDLHDAITQRAIDGKGMAAWQKDFDAIVQKHGWTGWTGQGTKQGEAWRSRIIYTTNMSTSYAAGRWKQLTDPELLKLNPYLRYVHSDGVRHPRPHHLAWNGTTLPWDDPFWATHGAPNGWGCKCSIVSASGKDYAAAKGEGKAERPENWDEIDLKTGAPVGIDKGWDYNPGASAQRPMQDFIDQKLIKLDAPIGAAMWQQLKPVLAAERKAAYGDWLGAVLADPVKRGRLAVVGALSPEVVSWLAERSVRPATAEIAVGDAVVVGKKARRHANAGDALTAAEWANLPGLLDNPEQVLYDKHSGHLIYVVAASDGRSGKLAVEFDYLLKKPKGETNMIISAYKTEAGDIAGAIKGGQYDIVK